MFYRYFIISFLISTTLHLLLVTDGWFTTSASQNKKAIGSIKSKNSVSISIKTISRKIIKENKRARKKAVKKPIENKNIDSTAGAKKNFESLFKITPTIPELSLIYNETGVSTLEVKYDSKGNILSIALKKSSGHSRLDAEAIRATRNAKYLGKSKNPSNTVHSSQISIKFEIN